MSNNYAPPIWTEHAIQAATSAQMSVVSMELHKAQKSQGIENPAAAKARKEREDREMKRKSMILVLIAGLSIAASGLAMWIEASFIVALQAIFPLFTAPYNLILRQKIGRYPTFREIHNMLRLRVNELQLENEELEQFQEKLEGQASHLNAVEGELALIASKSGSNVNQLMDLVKENGEILREMEVTQERAVMTAVLQAVIQSDRDQNSALSENEIEILILKLRTIQGVQNLNEERLRTELNTAHSNTLREAVKITKNILRQKSLRIVRDAQSQRNVP